MGSVRFGIVLLVLASLTTAKDVFRYEDEETGQSHYMTGEPGKAVEGGWKFTNGDGTFELVYKADEAGFQPEADHIPVHGEDTDEVKEAQTQFYSLYKEAEARIADGFKPEDEYLPDTAEVEEAKKQFYNLYEEAEARVADAIAAAEKETTMEDGAAKVVEIAKREAEPYWHMPYLLNHKKEDLEGKAFKFEYYKGFVPLEEGEESVGPVFKHVPYRGFVPEKRLEAETEAKAKHEEAIEKYKADAKARHEEAVAFYKARQEEAKEKHDEAVAMYKARYEAAVTKHKEAVAAYKEKMENTVYTFSPYYGYLPTTGEEPEDVPTFKFIPYKGFVPQDTAKTMTKREAEPHGWGPAPYWHMPYLLNHKKEDLEGKAFKFEYYKGFVPLEEGEESVGPVFKHVPYRGFVPEKRLEAEAEAKAKHEEAIAKYKADAMARHEEAVAFYKARQEEAKEKHDEAVAMYKARHEAAVAKHKEAVAAYKEKMENMVYTFSPYYGYLPTTGEVSEDVPTFKFIPYKGFVPQDTAKTMTKREAEPYGWGPAPYWHPRPYFLHHTKEDLEGKTFKFHPIKGFEPLEEDEESSGPVFKHVPYRGFVPEKQLEAEAEAKAKHEEAVAKYQADAKARHEEAVAVYKKAREEAKAKHEAAVAKYEAEAKARYEKVVAYRKEAMAKHKEAVAAYKEKIENTVYIFSPYYGYIPTTGEESEEVPTFKYVPYHGFVPSDMDDSRRKRDTSDEMMEDDNLMVESNQKLTLLSPFGYMHNVVQPKEISYEFHPYYGYIPKLKTSAEETEGDAAAAEVTTEEKLYKYIPFYGFVPAEDEMEKTEEEEEEPVLYKYHPFHGFVPAKDQEDTEEPVMKTIDQLEYKYVPYVGFVPATEDDTAEEKEGTEETTEKRYKFHPYYGFVEKTTEGEEEPKEEQMYKFVPYYGFVPVNKDGESEMEQKSEDGDDQQHQFTYSFHPYYGYLPTLVKKGDADVAEEQFYKLDPILGFVPAKTDEEDTQVETVAVEEAKRKKREAQTFIYPSIYHPSPMGILHGGTYLPLTTKTAAEEGETSETVEDTKPAQPATPVVLPGLVPGYVPFTAPVFSPLPVVVQQPTLPSDFPVIESNAETNEQAAFEF